MNALVDAVEKVFVNKYHANKVLEHAFKENKKWGSKDRRFIAENFYSIVRWWRKILYSLQVDWDDEKNYIAKDPLFSRAIQAWLIKHYDFDRSLWTEASELPFSEDKILRHWKEKKALADEESVPDWMNSYGEAQLQKKWPETLRALNFQAQVYLRVNTKNITAQNLKKELFCEDVLVDVVENNLNSLRLAKRKNIFVTNCFKKGFFEMQDLGSQKISIFLNPKPGERILDACAGAGGKSLHLADLMKNKGKILASDIREWKLKELKKRARRGSFDLIESKVLTSKQIKRMSRKFDALLLDVPCSGVGVLKRNPDFKWKLTEERLRELQDLQRELLNKYSEVVRPGGRMVYATCSVFPDENENQIKNFLIKNPNWSLDEDVSLFPGETDGFYMARLFYRPKI